jgi:hypothetical protein
VDGTPELQPMLPKLDRHLGKAIVLFGKAEARCQAAKRGGAKRGLRDTRRRLFKLGKALNAKSAPRISSSVTEPIVRRTTALAADVRTLSGTIACH